MPKDSFLDTNVIFNYSNYTEESGRIIKKCYLYIVEKKGRFLVCGTVLEELTKIIKKRARIHKAVVSKIENPDYSFENNFLIPPRDIPFAKQLYEKFKNRDPKEISYHFSAERNLSQAVIQKFLTTLVDEKVIPAEDIKKELVNSINDIISNHADCKILASAIQLQEKRETFLFVTADSKDLDPNAYTYLKEHFKINFPDKNYRFPELLNLIFTG